MVDSNIKVTLDVTENVVREVSKKAMVMGGTMALYRAAADIERNDAPVALGEFDREKLAEWLRRLGDEFGEGE